MKKIISVIILILVLSNMGIFLVHAAYTTTNDGYTVVNYARAAVDTHEMSRKGLCQTFAWECLYNTLGVPNKAGCGCCATKAWQSYGVSSSRDDIPLGAMVYFGGSSTIDGECGQEAGHVGVYIGNNEIAHAWSSTIICKTTIDYVLNCGYYYRGWGWQGGYPLATEVPLVPEAPTITSVSAVSTSSLKVKWSAVENATTYEIYRRKPGESWSGLSPIASTSTTSYTDEGLDAGTKYYYRVIAVNGSLKSEPSETNSSYTKPKTIAAVTFADITTNSVTLEWSSVKSAVSYDIYKRKSGESWSDSEPIANTVSTYFVDNDLEPGGKYYYRIVVVNESTKSEISESFSVYAKLNAPTLSGFSKITTSSLTITWNKVDKATSYDVYRRKSGESWSNSEPIANVTTTYYNDSNLDAGGKYYYRIVALNGSTSSVQSESFSAYTAYNVLYNANGGSGEPSSDAKLYDVTLNLSDIIPVREGYIFKEWNTKTDGSGTAYNPGDAYVVNANVTLYAQWVSLLPYIDAVVTKINNTYNVNVELADIDKNCEIIIAGYKSDRFVTLTNATYESKEINTTITGEIDKIKVMVWSDFTTLKPLCITKMISSNEFVVE